MPTLTQLAAYYLECIARDRDDGISVYASNRYGLPDYGQILIWPDPAAAQDMILTPAVKNVLQQLRRTNFSRQLVLGYPVSLRYVTSKKGNHFMVVEPLLYQTCEVSDIGAIPILTQEAPRINPDAIGHLAQCDPRDVTNEIINIAHALGLDRPIDEQPDLAMAAQKLQKERDDWHWREDIDVSHLTNLDLSVLPAQADSAGIYNAAAFFTIEKSKFTHGLELELNQLRQIKGQSAQNILGMMLQDKVPVVKPAEMALIEPLELNDEQRLAVRSAMTAPLTVVTGPPGTGKSQVVSSIVINAAYYGQTVLFASKNNKAVDVVASRLNNLSDSKIMIRLGSNTEDQDLRGQLIAYLNALLSTVGTANDESSLISGQKRHLELLAQLSRIRAAGERLVKLRNEVDQIDRNIDELRIKFGKTKFAEFGHTAEEHFLALEQNIDDYAAAVEASDRSQQCSFIRLIWPLIKKQRLEKVKRANEVLIPEASFLAMTEEDIPDVRRFAAARDYVQELRRRLDEARRVRAYFAALHRLQSETSLSKLAAEEQRAQEDMLSNSQRLWEAWLRLLPNRLNNQQRRCISDFSAILQQIMDMGRANSTYGKKLWAKYYDLLPKVLSTLPVWAVTSLSAHNRVPFADGFFDLVVIDEASQCDIASALPLLYRAKRAVIIGDVKQLRHISTLLPHEDEILLGRYGLSEDERSWDYRVKSLFEFAQRFVTPPNLIELLEHHRSHADIIGFSNRLFYDDKLRIITKYEHLHFPDDKPAVRWINVSGNDYVPNSGGVVNNAEAEAVVHELSRLVGSGYKGSIGVVTPFRAQVNLLRDKIAANSDLDDRLRLRDFMVETVHRFQGDERDVIIYSPVVALGISKGAANFLKNTVNLFNVAVTRARAALIIVGDKNYCSGGDGSPGYLRNFVAYHNKLETFYKQQTALSTAALGPDYPAVSSNVCVSNWEKILYQALYQADIHTLPQYTVMQYTLDLALIQGQHKLDIEVDGEHYHRDWNGELCRRDQLRNQRLLECGWDVMRFWVYEIRDDSPNCVARVKKWRDKTVK